MKNLSRRQKIVYLILTIALTALLIVTYDITRTALRDLIGNSVWSFILALCFIAVDIAIVLTIVIPQRHKYGFEKWA